MHADEIPSFRLDDKVALVTGSSKGLGRAMAFALGNAGASVAINYCNGQETAESCFAEYQRAGFKGGLFRGNVIDEADVNRMCAEIVAQLGPVDILVLNATPDQPHKPIEQYDWDFYQSMLDFFVKSPYLLTRATLASMKHRHHGRILNITTENVERGVGNFSAYVAAKGAQMAWTRSMAIELARWNITVNSVAPGWIPVERHANDSQISKDEYERIIPMGHFGVPSDVGGATVFLASEAARFITGQTIHVNGGVTVY